jgi:hypothetical protein
MELLRRIRIGMTREEVIASLGTPTDTGCTSRKYKSPSIYKYGDVEMHFEPGPGGRLFLVYTEMPDGEGRTLMRGNASVE